MTTKQRERLIEIVEFYSSLIGTDTNECNELITMLSYDIGVGVYSAEAMEIIDRVTIATGYTFEDIIGASRKKPLSFARHLAIFQVYRELYIKTHLTIEQIGAMFNRNHATILHSIREAENLIDVKDPLFMAIKNRYDESKQRSAA